MPPKVEATIKVDADFSNADKKLKNFVKAMENEATYKKSSVQRMTQPFLKTHFDQYLKRSSYERSVEDRIRSYVTARAKKGAFGEDYASKTREEKAAFIDEKVTEFKSKIWKQEKERLDKEKKAKIQEKRKQEEQAKRFMSEDKWNKKMNKLHAKALLENKAFDEKKKKLELKAQLAEEREKEKNRRKLFNAMFMKWGKLGIAGLIAGQAIKYIVKGATAINQVAQTSLGHQMTIEGGASSGSFFGGSMAAMQRAGISSKEYGSWKRGMMGKIGGIKLGMGNAAPFMALGVSTLDRLDDVELQIEKRLQRLPAETSWALGSQLGMSYELWERMYKGEIDRSKPGYDEDAIKAWAEAAKNINEVLTDIKVFFYNTLGPLAKLLTSKEGWDYMSSSATGGLLPGMMGFGAGGAALSLAINVRKDGSATVDTSDVESQNIDTYVQYS